MHTIDQIRAEYKRLDQIVGVDTTHLEIVFSPRSVYQYGCCRYQKRGKEIYPCKILIASFLQQEEEAFWDTVRHEYAHAAAALLTGKNQGRGPVWQSVCRAVGAVPNRLAETCAAQKELRKSRIKYTIVCQSCGAHYPKVRRSRFVDAVLSSDGKPIAYRCSCGGRTFRCF